MAKLKNGELIAVKTLGGWRVTEYRTHREKEGKFLYRGMWYKEYRKATVEEVSDYIKSLEAKLERAKEQERKLEKEMWGEW